MPGNTDKNGIVGVHAGFATPYVTISEKTQVAQLTRWHTKAHQGQRAREGAIMHLYTHGCGGGVVSAANISALPGREDFGFWF